MRTTVARDQGRHVQDRTFGERLRLFALAAVAVAVLGMMAGWLYAQGNPRAAAGALVTDFILVEPNLGNDEGPADPDAVAPTSGQHLGTVRCDVGVEELGNDDHLATLAAGNIVVRVHPDITTGDLGILLSFALDRGRMLVAEEPRLDAPIVALSWAHRMPLNDLNLELLAAFHTARVGLGPDPDSLEDPCSP